MMIIVTRVMLMIPLCIFNICFLSVVVSSKTFEADAHSLVDLLAFF